MMADRERAKAKSGKTPDKGGLSTKTKTTDIEIGSTTDLAVVIIIVFLFGLFFTVYMIRALTVNTEFDCQDGGSFCCARLIEEAGYPCGIGEGQCVSDEECDGKLICDKKHGGLHICLHQSCPAGKSCCSEQYEAGATCGLGEGDCDDDAECEGDLVCGDNNCNPTLDDFYVGSDCCVEPGNYSCNGGTSCCTDLHKAEEADLCKRGEGDCDWDWECQAGKCGSNNCEGPGYEEEDDCCA